MRALTFTEVEYVSGGAGGSFSWNAEIMTGLGFLGLAVSVPVIVGGAVLGVPTLGLGFVAMTAGILGTILSGAMTVTGIVWEAKTLANSRTNTGI